MTFTWEHKTSALVIVWIMVISYLTFLISSSYMAVVCKYIIIRFILRSYSGTLSSFSEQTKSYILRKSQVSLIGDPISPSKRSESDMLSQNEKRFNRQCLCPSNLCICEHYSPFSIKLKVSGLNSRDKCAVVKTLKLFLSFYIRSTLSS